MKALFFIFLYVFSLTSFAQHIIPGAQKQPKWVFPVWIQNGDGQRDTVYIGYHKDAKQTGGADSIFGEVYEKVDTNAFNARFCTSWGCGPGKLCDSARKVMVSDFANFSSCGNGGGVIDFLNVKFPLEIRWDDSTFYSDSLPYNTEGTYPDSLPKAYGKVWCSNFHHHYSNCGLGGHHPPFIFPEDPLKYFNITHFKECYFIPPSSIPYYGSSPCITTNNLIFYGDTSLNIPYLTYNFELQIRKYEDDVFVPQPEIDPVNISIAPNPFRGSTLITISEETNQKLVQVIAIYDVYGREVYKAQINDKRTELNLSTLLPGIYFLRLTDGEKNTHTEKLILSK